jgi:hypothetical protein
MAKKRKQAIEVVDRRDSGEALYALMDGLIAENHKHLSSANVALAWKIGGWKPDDDGIRKLGQCKKASELDQRLSGYDFVILLNREAWEEDLSEDQRRALLDHELCHAEVKVDGDGEQAADETGRRIWRIRKHDVEEFEAIVQRHGLYKRDLEHFAAACAEKRKRPPLLRLAEDPAIMDGLANLAPKRGSGIESVEISSPGHGSVTLTAEDGDRLREAAARKR